MFSIVIPTCWFAEEIIESIKQLEECTLVDDIIIIDNNVNDRPYFLHNEKLRIFSQYKNIYVSEAWNTGVRLAKNNNICLLNDDIILNDAIFEFISRCDNYGLIGLEQSSIVEIPCSINLELKQCDDIHVGYGCCMFIHKTNYINIPADIKVLYSDNFLFDSLIRKNFKNYSLMCSIKGRIGATTLSKKINFDEDADERAYRKSMGLGFMSY